MLTLGSYMHVVFYNYNYNNIIYTNACRCLFGMCEHALHNHIDTRLCLHLSLYVNTSRSRLVALDNKVDFLPFYDN